MLRSRRPAQMNHHRNLRHPLKKCPTLFMGQLVIHSKALALKSIVAKVAASIQLSEVSSISSNDDYEPQQEPETESAILNLETAMGPQSYEGCEEQIEVVLSESCQKPCQRQNHVNNFHIMF